MDVPKAGGASKGHVNDCTERDLSPAQFVILTHRIRLVCWPQARSPALFNRHEDHAAGGIQPFQEMPFPVPSPPFLAGPTDRARTGFCSAAPDRYRARMLNELNGSAE